MSYELKKPITETQRVDFIAKYNHCHGFKIEDTEMFLFALEKDEIMGEKEIEIETEEGPDTITIPYPVKNPDFPAIELENAKSAKIAENDKARDTALLQGVTYQNVIFDSDTDQKVNLMYVVSAISDTDTITWFGMNNDSLECSKVDLLAIGGLITELHAFCWNKNAQIKNEINEAITIEDVNDIEIDYSNVG